MVMWGANADELDGLATLLDAKAAELDRAYRQLSRQLYSAPWKGSSADRFRSRWCSVHGQQVGSSVSYLRSGSRMLRDNARQQRDASGSGSGTIGAPILTVAPTHKEDRSSVLDRLDEVLKLLGLPGSVISEILTMVAIMDDKTVADVVKSLDHPGIVTFFNKVGTVLGLAGTVVGFFHDIAEHPNLPTDERIVHAVIETGLKVVEDLGAKEGTQLATQALLGALGSVVPVIGTGTGIAIGFVVGQVVKAGVDFAESHLHLTEKGADLGLEAYQYLKEHNFDPGKIALDLVDKGVDAVVDGAENLAADVAHGASNLVKGGEHLLSSLNPF